MKLLFAALVVGTFMISPTLVLGQSFNLEQARKEGEVVLYSTITVSAFNELNTAIKEKYPFLNVRHIRLGPAQQLARIMQEQRLGHFIVDVIYNNLLHLIYLKDNGILGKYESSENKFLMKEAIDPDGFWVGGDIDVLITGFNSRMISRRNVPTTYDGFLDGRLKGQMAINTNNPYALVGMVSLRGEEQGVAYIRKLAQQSLRPVQGFTHMVNLLAAGEYPIALMSQVTKIEEMKEKGAPVDWVSQYSKFQHRRRLYDHPHPATPCSSEATYRLCFIRARAESSRAYGEASDAPWCANPLQKYRQIVGERQPSCDQGCARFGEIRENLS
jgi:Bacterial extracellular solute-binding protein